MARIPGSNPSQGGLFTGLFIRAVYSAVKRKLGKLVMPVQVTAHHPRILWGYALMEQALVNSRLVSLTLKGLAQLRAATLIGCPF